MIKGSPIIDTRVVQRVVSARPFTMKAFNIVLQALGKRKASGPDTIPAELLQSSFCTSSLFTRPFLSLFQTGQAPSSWLHPKQSC